MRGAVVFHQPQLSCVRCHVADDRLGPDLSTVDAITTDASLVESILDPSEVIRKGYETVLLTVGEDVQVGIVESEADGKIVFRDAAADFKAVTIDASKVTDRSTAEMSLMPGGLINLLASEQQFFDLVRYLIEIRDGGADRARELEPDPALLVARPLPEYESAIDHRGFLAGLDDAAFDRGAEIYERLCINCHGTESEPGSLPTSLRFHADRFKNGNDPFTMYQTLTRGFGMMAAQTWMVPSQKYDVIHYIREHFVKRHNEAEYFAIDEAYLAGLPKGESRGPAPSKITKWQQMDYGPNQVMTLEIGKDASNFAYKGNVVRLDSGPGGIARGKYWLVYDYDTLRVAAAWTGDDPINWQSIHFDGKHAIHPRLKGDVLITNPTGPGWGRPSDGSFEDVRLVGRDKRIYGPLPRDWAQYSGMYYHGSDTLIEYTVGKTKVLELPGVLTSGPRPVVTRTFNVGPRKQDMMLQVAHNRDDAKLAQIGGVAIFGHTPTSIGPVAPKTDASDFGGGYWLEAKDTTGLNVGDGDFTITARIRTEDDGTIVAQTARGSTWVPDGLTWFVRGGHLSVDIGWVGVCRSRARVDDGKWHDVAVTYEHRTGDVTFFVDGRRDRRTGTLVRNEPLRNAVVRIGYTAADFPEESAFKGRLTDVRFYNDVLNRDEIARVGKADPHPALAAHWNPAKASNGFVRDPIAQPNPARLVLGEPAASSGKLDAPTIASYVGDTAGFEWVADGPDLRLRIPAGDAPLRFTCWFTSVDGQTSPKAIIDSVGFDDPARDLSTLTGGGPRRWSQILETEAILGKSDGPFEVDVLKRPADNPWFCRMRLTGFDFTDDGDTAIVSAWDGSMWKVRGLNALPENATDNTIPITWQRIASGLYQPLGVKIVDGQIYVTCRDQLCILHDKNGDGEIDYFESFNNDHQVTDHFHEFAMGLQTDDDGNFYYAKSARHAKTALVPHHGTLLKVSKDGQRTEIVANGFRAANGVCINPDGTFIVTDQEGHWNPKNRINYVKQGGFYGNMYGYHDVTDTADDAMEQPLVWITNGFDRSPGELLWVDSPKWGPLQGRLLNLSYGYGMVYVVPHEEVDGQMQGGMCAFPIKRSPTGIMRGRFHPKDGQLYMAGMFAWAGSQQQPGGLYRLRYTGRPVHLPVELSATKRGMTIAFSGELDVESAKNVKNWRVKAWDLKRTKRYGSKHFNERAWEVKRVRVDADRKTVHLEIPEIAPTWGMEIRYTLKSVEGKAVKGNVHNTIHVLR